MDDSKSFTLADMTRAAATSRTRIQEVMKSTRIRGRRHRGGATPCRFTIAEATLILLAQRLRELGMSAAAASEAVEVIRFEDLHAIIVEDLQRWLVVSADNSAELADISRVLDIAESQEDGLGSLRLVAVHAAIRALFTMKLERAKGVNQSPDAKIVHFDASGTPDGAFLTSDMRLAIVQSGRGTAVKLLPQEARDLAQQLYHLVEAEDREVPN